MENRLDENTALNRYRYALGKAKSRQELPSLDVARKAYEKAQSAHDKAKAKLQEVLTQASQRAAQEQERARQEQKEALSQAADLETQLNQLLDQGGSEEQGTQLEARLSFTKRKAERAGQIAEEKPTLTRSELRHLRSVLQEERDAAHALGRAYDDVEQALAVDLERMLAQWPRQESLSPHDALPQSQLLRNTFPQVSAYTPGDFVSEILNN